DFTMHAIDREKLRVLFNQLEFRTLLPRILEALGAAEPDAEPIDAVGFEVDVRAVRDAGEAVAAIDELSGQSDRVALDARWAGVAGRSAVLGLAAARTTDAAVYFDAATLETPAVREALARLVGEDGPPLVVHRAKELTHGLHELDLRALESDTAIMAYLLDPA